MASIGTTRVEELMTTNVITIRETDKMQRVAKLFESSDINAAPVVNREGTCVGVFTSHDLVEFEAVRREYTKQLSCGSVYGVTNYLNDEKYRMPGLHFDEVSFHMTTQVQSACVDDPLSAVARRMCQNHIHHVVVLDDQRKPIGFLSALDLLAFVVGEPVQRSTG